MASGAKSEQLAAAYLAQQGLVLVEANFRCRLGEIDLIMRHGVTLVFIEVRQRSSRQFGGAIASIDQRKQHKLVVTAQFYLARLGRLPPCRFDVLLIQGEAIEWLRDAFSA